jgi:ABC-type dipeptide/oligopeptide/nickel transport system permease component
VVSVVFLLIHLVPGDPIVQMLGEGATASDISALRHAYGLDAPLSQQYSTTGTASSTPTSANPSASTTPSPTS